MNKDEKDQFILNQTLNRLIEAGVCSISEILEACDESKLINPEYLEEALNDNPFIGRSPDFQDLIEQAVLGKLARKGD